MKEDNQMDGNESKAIDIAQNTREKAENDTDELLTIDELAAKTKMKRSFYYAPIRRKGPDAIPCLKVGKYIRYRMSDVMNWIEKNQERE
jgi:predicted DNA-binding transcriptional regulator AlpA